MTLATPSRAGVMSAPAFRLNLRYLVLIGLIIVASVGFGLANPNFYSLTNLGILLRSISVLFLVSWGMTFVMLTGGIDLSVGSNVAFSGAVGVVTLAITANPFLAFVAAIAAGMAIGLLNGALIGQLRLSPFVVTLATYALARGLALIIYGADSINVSDPVFLWLGGTSWGEIPVVLPFIAIVFAGLSILLYRTPFGRDVYAAGSNFRTANVLGRQPGRKVALVYVLLGGLAGISAIITVGRVSSGQPWAGLFLEFDAITAVILGGTALTGGRGRLLGTALGVLLYGVIINGLVLTGINPYMQNLIKGLILLGVVILDTLVSRRQNP